MIVIWERVFGTSSSENPEVLQKPSAFSNFYISLPMGRHGRFKLGDSGFSSLSCALKFKRLLSIIQDEGFVFGMCLDHVDLPAHPIHVSHHSSEYLEENDEFTASSPILLLPVMTSTSGIEVRNV